MWPLTPSKGRENASENPPFSSETEINGNLTGSPPPESSHSTAYVPSLTGAENSRLSIPFLVRVPLTVAFSVFSGFVLGAAKGGSQASFRYRAENSHRFPTTKAGWYLYHKSKNYHSIIGGVKEGVRLGGRLSGWAVLCVGSEEVIDRLRGGGDDRHRDFAGTVCAGMAVAGMFSWKSGADLFTSARMAKIALKVSLLYGLTQDVLSTLRGRRPAYMDWLLTHVLGQRNKIEA